MTDRDEIMALCRRLGEAHNVKDPDAIAACYAPDATIYSLAPPLATRGMDRDDIAAWLDTWRGPVHVDARDADLSVSGDLACVSALNRMRGVKTDGEAVDLWFRTTMCLRKTGNGWRIVHDHASVPFYMDGSYRAAVDLAPEPA
ncbi:MAG: nuclear transport factor 2 family protein [Alphaproteobacteria bacterium]